MKRVDSAPAASVSDGQNGITDPGGRLVRLLKDVAIASNEAKSVGEVFKFALDAVAAFTGWKVGHAFVRHGRESGDVVQLIVGPLDESYSAIRRATVEGRFDPLTGLPGRVFASGDAEWVEDVRVDPRFLRNELVSELNVGAGIAVPVSVQNEVLGVMEFFAAEAESPDEHLLETMTVIGTQLGRVVERDRVQRRLIDQDHKLLAAQRIAGLGYWEWNPETGRLLWTDQLHELYGLDPAGGIEYDQYISLIHEDDRAAMASVIERALQDHRPYSHIHRIVRPDGAIRYIQAQGEIETDDAGRVTKMSGTALDVTRLKKAEADLRDLQERTRALTDSAVEAIVTIDDAGRIVGWNESAARVFGYEFHEVEGLPLTRMMPERYHAAHEAGIKRVQASGEKKFIGGTIEIEGLRKTGEEFPIELSLSMWDVAGRTFFGGIIRDVSERKRVEHQLVRKSDQLRRLAARLQKVREEERTRLSREVHDLLGQSLTGLRMDIAMLEKTWVDEDGPIPERFDAMKQAVDEAVNVVRRISSDLRPGVLDDLGIQAALEWELSKFGRRTGLRCDFDDLTGGGTILDDGQSTAVFRVFQELLTNVARHAEAQVLRTSIEVDERQFLLMVEDDGVGIKMDNFASTTSLGVLGMRERLAPWDGEIEFRGAPGKGTRVLVKVPLVLTLKEGRR